MALAWQAGPRCAAGHNRTVKAVVNAFSPDERTTGLPDADVVSRAKWTDAAPGLLMACVTTRNGETRSREFDLCSRVTELKDAAVATSI